MQSDVFYTLVYKKNGDLLTQNLVGSYLARAKRSAMKYLNENLIQDAEILGAEGTDQGNGLMIYKSLCKYGDGI